MMAVRYLFAKIMRHYLRKIARSYCMPSATFSRENDCRYRGRSKIYFSSYNVCMCRENDAICLFCTRVYTPFKIVIVALEGVFELRSGREFSIYYDSSIYVSNVPYMASNNIS